MNNFVFAGVKYLLLFSMFSSTLSFQNGTDKKEHSSGVASILSQTEMGNITGGDVYITIYAPGDTLYWMAAGALLGFIFVGSGGILPGAFYGGLFGIIFG